MSSIRIVTSVSIQLLGWIFPGCIRKAILKFIGLKLGANVSVGRCVIISSEVRIGENVSIGNFNVFWDLGLLSIGNNSQIGSRNLVRGSQSNVDLFTTSELRRSSFIIGSHSAITSRHYFDCSDRITVGDFTTIAGRGIEIWTHGIDVRVNRQITKPVEIGSYNYICTGARFLAGAHTGNMCVVAAGSVVTTAFQSCCLIGGIPARERRKMCETDLYFSREIGVVD